MQTRKDRIQFPAVISSELWGTDALRESVYGEEIMDVPKFGTPPSGTCKTPHLVTPDDLVHRGAEEYFKTRERLGLVSPPRTPSDILRRGPLFESDDSDSSEDRRQVPPPGTYNAS